MPNQQNYYTEISIEEGYITNRPQEGDSASPDAEPYCHVIFVQACLKEKVPGNIKNRVKITTPRWIVIPCNCLHSRFCKIFVYLGRGIYWIQCL